MKKFDYANVWQAFLKPDFVSLLTQIHEYKGEQNLLIETKGNILTNMREIAKIQSIETSNKLEGIYLPGGRLKEIVQNSAQPQSANEQAIAGYCDVLATIHESREYAPVCPNMILQLYRELYKYGGKDVQTVYDFEIKESVEHLCNEFSQEMEKGIADPLLLIPIFVLDFLCIHPFHEGNGRMSRLLTLLLLSRAGYLVGRYISIEMLVENTKEAYFDVIQRSSENWYESKGNHEPFVSYTLGIILNAYREFSTRVKFLRMKGMSKSKRIRVIVEKHTGKITKHEILNLCPDISAITVQRTLSELLKKGEITKISGGRYTSYQMNRDKRESKLGPP
ncbi:MAG: Fic family protein [Bacillota bacterium]|jgi:Fic family protein|nr:Fic family protein [Bacillota bacterium]